MRLLYIITKSELGGAQSHVADLIEGFAARNATRAERDRWELHVAASAEGPLLERARAVGAATSLLPRLQRSVNPLVDMAAVRECAALLRRVRPDLVHAHSSKAGAVARLAGRRAQAPVVYTAHGWGFSEGVPRARRALAWLVEAALAPLSARIICVCESDRRLALRARVGRARQLCTIHNGIAPDAPRARPAQQPPRLVMVARFSEQKDQPTLLRALHQLERQAPQLDYSFDFIGTGPLLEHSQTLARELALQHRVTFLGDCHDVPQRLASAQAFVLATHYEGLPISILEAMRAGLPIVASNVGGITEQISLDTTGMLVPPGDVATLAQAVLQVIESPTVREQWGQAGRAKFEREFSRAGMLDRVEELYREVLAALV